MHVALFFCDIRSAMVNKHLELAKRQAQDRYGRFASPSSHTALPPSRHEVGSFSRRCTAPPPSLHEVRSSSHRHTTPPPSRMQEVGSSSHRRTAPLPSSNSNDSMEMWVAAPPPPPPLCLQVTPPPPLACLAPSPPLTRV
jgi:hypothetical protein